MTPDQLERLRALLAPLVAAVATCPLTDSEDKKDLMRLWYAFNESVLSCGEDHS